MTNTYSRPAQKLDLRRRVKSVLERLSSCAPHSSHEQVSCFRNHRILTSQINNQAMSIGCFGECSFGSDSSDSSSISNRENHGRKVHCKFYPPIQTLLREKDPEKWWVILYIYFLFCIKTLNYIFDMLFHQYHLDTPHISLSYIRCPKCLCLRYTDMVNDLATVGEDPNQFNSFGEAPLCVAAYKGQVSWHSCHASCYYKLSLPGHGGGRAAAAGEHPRQHQGQAWPHPPLHRGGGWPRVHRQVSSVPHQHWRQLEVFICLFTNLTLSSFDLLQLSR